MIYPVPKRLWPNDREWYVAWGGPSFPEPPTKLRCYLFGCRLGSPVATNVRQFKDGSGSGSVGSVACQRCGRCVYPWDKDYPPILP